MKLSNSLRRAFIYIQYKNITERLGLQVLVILIYSTKCNQLSHWLHSSESYCLRLDAIKHNLILWGNRTTWSWLPPFTTMLKHNRPPLVCCEKLWEIAYQSRQYVTLHSTASTAWFSFNAVCISCMVCQVSPWLCNRVLLFFLAWSFVVFHSCFFKRGQLRL